MNPRRKGSQLGREATLAGTWSKLPIRSARFLGPAAFLALALVLAPHHSIAQQESSPKANKVPPASVNRTESVDAQAQGSKHKSEDLSSPDTTPKRGTPIRSWERRVDEVIASSEFKNGHWGLLVVDGKTGTTIYERNADELFAPASVTKLFSTAAALAKLGANYRFQTPIVRRGTFDEKTGVLDGDLILVAQGDLCMGGRTGTDGSLLFSDDDHTYANGNPDSQVVAADPLAGLDHLAREVQASGIKKVTGDVIVDDRLFAPARATGSGPRRISPIMINDNVIDVLARPAAKLGEPADVRFIPATQFVTMDSLVSTVDKDQTVRLSVKALGPRRFSVRGQVPVGHAQVVKIYEIDEPASFARALLIEALRQRSVEVSASPLGQNTTRDLPARAEVLKLPKVAEYTSPPFREYLRVILKVSHNLHASTLPLLLAAQDGLRNLKDGLRRQGELLKSMGVDPSLVSFGGGAGGSRADLATPRATVTLLRSLAARPDFPSFDAALPIMGRDGTLARTVSLDSPVRGHAHAKTGTYWVDNDLRGTVVLTSKALAGYMETASGRSLVFAFFLNNVPLNVPRPGHSVSEVTASAGRLLGRLCEVFYLDEENARESVHSTKSATPRTGDRAASKLVEPDAAGTPRKTPSSPAGDSSPPAKEHRLPEEEPVQKPG